MAVSDDDDVTSNRVVREMDARIRELEPQLGRKTMEVEILKEALDKARPKNRCGSPRRSRRTVRRSSVIAQTIGVSRSQLHARLARRVEPRRRYHKAQDAVVVPLITGLVAARPTYGYRRITALLNRQLRASHAAPVNHKRVYRIMQAHSLLLARRYSVRSGHAHDGKVVTLRSNLRWCSDGFEFTWPGTARSSVAPSSSTPAIAR